MKGIIKKRYILLIFFCYIVLISVSFARPMIMKNIMDNGIIKKDFRAILYLVIFLLVLIAIEEVITIIQTKLFAKLQNKLVLKLYEKVGRILFRSKMEYFAHNNSAEIVSRLSTDIESVSSLVDSNIMYVFGYVLQIISGVAGLFIINWRLAFLVLAVVPVKYMLIRICSEKEEKTMEQWIESSADFSAWLGDAVNGIREVKLWNLYSIKQGELKQWQEHILHLNKKSRLIQAYNMSGESAVQGLAIAAIYGIGGFLICREQLTLGSLTAFISYSNYVINPISLVLNLKMIFAKVKPSAQRLQTFLKTETEKGNGSDIREMKDKLSFHHVGFSYTDQPVVEDVNFEVKKGEKIAIIGENGSGKSTLLSLLLRFIEPREGTICMDGTDIREYDIEQYRSLFSVVNQEIYLFEDTVWNNLVLGKEMDAKNMDSLCERMGMQEFLNKLPQGYEEKLEKNGENLSGGERQKLSLLRAFVKDAPILVLDEATANIDKKYDEFLQGLFINDFFYLSFIVITHKTENLQGMDRVYEIKGHVLREVGKGGMGPE